MRKLKTTFCKYRHYALTMLVLLSFAVTSAQTSISQMSRFELLKKYAPIFHMGVNTGSDYYECQDLILAVDQDKNWGTYDDDDDVWASGSHWPRTTIATDLSGVNPQTHDVTPIVYGSFIELSDVYILCYEVYHTYNEIAGGIGDHLNDIEGVNVVIDKNGNIKGATSTVHSSVCWATPWASDDDPDIFDVYNNETYKLWLTGTHPHFWIGSNGAADLFYMTHGHAIFPFHQKMNSKGVTYSVAENDVPTKPTSIGYKQSGRKYSSSASYLIVPEEELLIKDQMSGSLNNMYKTGQSMGTWGGQFWGNGYYGYTSEGDGSSKKHARYRYNVSYGGNMSFNYIHHPVKGIGISSSQWVLQNIGGLALTNSVRSFYRNKYAINPGSGFFDNNGSSSNDLLSMSRTSASGNSFTIEAMVRRVGKLHLTTNWFSNPYNKSYVNGTGPTGGIMLRAGLNSGDNFIYIGYAPELEKVVFIKRVDGENGGECVVEQLNISNMNRYFKVENLFDGTIKIYSKDFRTPSASWVNIKTIDGNAIGLGGNIYGALLTQSDVNSDKNYYWTTGEYDAISFNTGSLKSASVVSENPVLKTKTKKIDLIVAPNPYNGEGLKLMFNSDSDLKATVNIYSSIGRLLFTEKQEAVEGENNITIYPDTIEPGVCILELIVGNTRETRKIIFK